MKYVLSISTPSIYILHQRQCTAGVRNVNETQPIPRLLYVVVRKLILPRDQLLVLMLVYNVLHKKTMFVTTSTMEGVVTGKFFNNNKTNIRTIQLLRWRQYLEIVGILGYYICYTHARSHSIFSRFRSLRLQ